MIMSARFHTSAAVSAICAPKRVYVSSSNPLPAPAFFSISTVCPACFNASAPPGTSATRFSLVLISFGTPMIMSPLRLFRPQPNHRLFVRIEVLPSQLRGLLQRNRFDPTHNFFHCQKVLVVECGARQAMQPAAAGLQRENDLAFELPLDVVQLVGRQPIPRELGVFLTNYIDRAIRPLVPRTDVHAAGSSQLLERLKAEHGIGEAELFPDLLEEP